jgi:O-antigen ligase
MRFLIVVAAYTLWLLAMFGVFYLVHGQDGNALQVTLMTGAIPAGCQLLLIGIDWRGLVALVKLWLLFLMVVLLSYLVNAVDPRLVAAPTDDLAIPVAWTPIVYTLNAVFILMVATVVAGCPERRLLRSVAGLFAILGAPFLVYVDITGERLWGRLIANDLQPNMWGLIGLTVCLGAFARKLGPLAIAALIAGTATILEASSRESLLALAGAAAVVLILQLREMNLPRLSIWLVGSCVTLILTALLFDPYILNAISYFSSDVLLLNNQERGIGSGLSGRLGVWSETIDLWMKSPVFGIGFRRHEQFLEGAPAHNAFLAMLADTGLVGLFWYLVLLLGSLVAAWRIGDPRTRRYIIAMIVAYIISGFFDRRTINGGNPYSLFFLLCCSVSLVEASRRKAAELHRKLGIARDVASTVAYPFPGRS